MIRIHFDVQVLRPRLRQLLARLWPDLAQRLTWRQRVKRLFEHWHP